MSAYDQDNNIHMTGDNLRELLEDYPRVTTPKIVIVVKGKMYFVRSHMVSMGVEQELVLYTEKKAFR